MSNILTIQMLENEIYSLADQEKAVFASRFFKSGPGEYGEGDRFLGIRVPVLRRLANKYRSIELSDCCALLVSPYHEIRLVALFILVQAYQRGNEATRQEIYQLYLSHLSYVNNWDLVDCSAEHIIGQYLWNRDKSVLYSLAQSESVWERRIAIMSTFCYIKAGIFDDTLRIADILLKDHHDLIQKAVGWMLREIGKRDRATAEEFLRPRYKYMPRTMLRYAIERYPEDLRQKYLRGELN
jgi:3-methyladenine DNA glycosylase AlkD